MPTLGIADDGDSGKNAGATSQLVKTLRANINMYWSSPPPGYFADPYCASGVEGGAVGIHFVNFGLVDNVLNAAEPEVLYYEPRPGGKIRLVGAEYVYAEVPLLQDGAVVFAPLTVTNQHIEGHLLQYIGAPNRFGIPVDFLRLNVWAWRHNPKGTFAADNWRVSCDDYDPILHAPSTFAN